MRSAQPALPVQGPRFKSKATQQFEQLISDILEAYSRGENIDIKQNELKETTIIVNNHTYYLTQILKKLPDFEHLKFTPALLTLYDTYLHDTQTAFKHLSFDSLASSSLAEMQQAFPNLSTAEISAVRIYTKEFYSIINILLRSHGSKWFCEEMKGLSSAYRTSLTALERSTGTPCGSVDFNKYAFREALLHLAFTCFALNKPIQNQVSFYHSPSPTTINISSLKGMALIIIGAFNLCQITLFAYNKMRNSANNIDLNNYFNNSQFKLPLTTAEVGQLRNTINSNIGMIQLASHFEDSLYTLCTSQPEIEALFSEKLYRVDTVQGPFQEKVDQIRRKITAKENIDFVEGFYSMSSNTLSHFHSAPTATMLITEVESDLRQTKIVECLSQYPDENERLIPPNSQVCYQSYQAVDAKQAKLVSQAGVRSLDDLDPFSYDADIMKAREIILELKKQALHKTTYHFLSLTRFFPPKDHPYWLRVKKEADTVIKQLENFSKINDSQRFFCRDFLNFCLDNARPLELSPHSDKLSALAKAQLHLATPDYRVTKATKKSSHHNASHFGFFMGTLTVAAGCVALLAAARRIKPS
jgi:hypothetical protein